MIGDDRHLFVHVIVPAGVRVLEPMRMGVDKIQWGMTIKPEAIPDAVSMLHELLTLIRNAPPPSEIQS
jgi:hypothetical protein